MLHNPGKELFFNENDIIVSKTDPQGRMTYANRIFYGIAGYTEAECMGRPHSIVRHPDMPRCVFQLLWERISSGREIFAYVKNRAKSGDYYWVFAHVTPSFDDSGRLTSYHSTRRVPRRQPINDTITPLYRDLMSEELRHANRKTGQEAGYRKLVAALGNIENYDEFVFSL